MASVAGDLVNWWRRGTPGSMIHQISVREHSLMRRINGWRPPRWVRWWMLSATRGGDGWLWVAMGVAVLLFGGERRLPAVLAAAMATLTGVVLFKVLKQATGRTRPCHLAPNCWATLLPPDRFSFPSGHTITAFAVAVSLGLFYPSLLVGLLFCAISVAASRILLGMHFLTDVLAGAMIGGLLGYAAFSLLSAAV
ncbi:MAG: phosphatase PAP2 family protein [Bryobacteraceae bacterium]